MKFSKKHIFGFVFAAAALLSWTASGSGDGLPPGAVVPESFSMSQWRQDPGGDECCSDPGQIAECWWQDAARDEVACLSDSKCSPHTCQKDAAEFGGNPSPTGEGLCECTYDADDINGGFGDCPGSGVCNPDGICGPSYCNGYLTCSCWGGCEEKIFGSTAESYDTPDEYCDAELAAAPYCCNGQYPNIPGTEATGYCSGDEECKGGGGPDSDSDTDADPVCLEPCDDIDDCKTNPCADPQCIANCCDYSNPDESKFGECLDEQTCSDGWSALGRVCCCNSDDKITGGKNHCPTLPCIDETQTQCQNYVCQLKFFNVDKECAGECSLADDACHTWRCSQNLSCVEYSKPTGTDCSDSVSGGNPDCGLYLCEEGAGGELECVLDLMVEEKIRCDDGSAETGICERRYCDLDGGCDFGKYGSDMDPGDLCPPSGDYQEMHCFEYRCNGSHQCDKYEALFQPTPDGGVREDCTVNDSDKLGRVSDGDITRSEDITCAIDDVDMAGSEQSDRFDMCDIEDLADFVYTFTSTTEKNVFGLKHTMIAVTDTETESGRDWGPLLYTTKAVKTADYLTYNQCSQLPGSQFTCNYLCDFSSPEPPYYDCTDSEAGDAVVSNGPWPLRDVPEYTKPSGENPANNWDSGDSSSGNTGYLMNDGFRIDNDWTAWVVVDSTVPTSPHPPGGSFDLKLKYEDHENNDCWNTAAYVAAPIIGGEQAWKERWRGTTVGYTNYICETAGPNPYVEDADGSGNCLDDDTGMQLAAGCWKGRPDYLAGGQDPGGAFFRVDFPTGKYKIYLDEAGLMWSANGYKNKASGAPAASPYAGADFMSAVLAFWGGPESQGACLDTLDPASNYCIGGEMGYPRERIFDLGAQGWHGWLEVSNNYPVAVDTVKFPGDVAMPRGEYELNVVKVPQGFLGFLEIFKPDEDASGGCGCETPTGTFLMEGYRLDMVPTNKIVKGYSVIANNVSTGSGYWLVDPDLGTGDGAIARTVDCEGDDCRNARTPYELPFAFPYAGDFFRYYCINAGGTINLRRSAADSCGSWDYEPSSKKITGQYNNSNPLYQGYGPMLMPLYGNIFPCWRSNSDGGDIWGFQEQIGTSCKSDGKGRIVRQTIPFEGTIAEVITFEGFDGRFHPSADRLNKKDSIQFQVIMRIDGRVSFYYRQPATADAWDNILAYNSWVVGISGTKWRYCQQFGDSDCANEFGVGSGVICDNTNITVPGEVDKVIYTAKNFCMFRMGQDSDYGGQSLISGISGP
jgi:hypothetical protein